jgi:hypothetical protein
MDEPTPTQHPLSVGDTAWYYKDVVPLKITITNVTHRKTCDFYSYDYVDNRRIHLRLQGKLNRGHEERHMVN